MSIKTFASHPRCAAKLCKLAWRLCLWTPVKMLVSLVTHILGSAELTGRLSVLALAVLVVFQFGLLKGMLAVLALHVVMQTSLPRVFASDCLVTGGMWARHEGLVAVTGDVILNKRSSHHQTAAAGGVGTANEQIVKLVMDYLRCCPGLVGKSQGQAVDGADGVQAVGVNNTFPTEDMVTIGNGRQNERQATYRTYEILVDFTLVLERPEVNDGSGRWRLTRD